MKFKLHSCLLLNYNLKYSRKSSRQVSSKEFEVLSVDDTASGRLLVIVMDVYHSMERREEKENARKL